VRPARWLFLAVPLSAATAACQDAVHDDEVSALGPEAPGVSPGPDHRPGQPCTEAMDRRR